MQAMAIAAFDIECFPRIEWLLDKMMRFVAKSIRRGWHDGEVILNSVHHRNCFICAWKQISPATELILRISNGANGRWVGLIPKRRKILKCTPPEALFVIASLTAVFSKQEKHSLVIYRTTRRQLFEYLLIRVAKEQVVSF